MGRLGAFVKVLLVLLLLYGAQAGVKGLDDDGVGFTEELSEGGTSPFNNDTDGDGLTDDVEISSSSNPTLVDTDDDGVDDKAELRIGTNQTVADTDDDGLTDADELTCSADPTIADTDDDGLLDGQEQQLRMNPASSDTDDDGLNDSNERRGESNPREQDTDGDALLDGREASIGTNLTNLDTDGDGLSDRHEVKARGPVGDGDPLRKDIFLEVSYDSRSDSLSSSQERNLERAFAGAPVSNPDGSSGISLHVRADSEPSDVPSSVSPDEYWGTSGVNDQTFDEKGEGFYHVLIVEDIENRREEAVGISKFDSAMVEEDSGGRHNAGSTTMHELGHMLGILQGDFRGIDSREVSYYEYASIMNYNSPTGTYRYSSTGGASSHDDWEAIEKNQDAPPVDNISVDAPPDVEWEPEECSA